MVAVVIGRISSRLGWGLLILFVEVARGVSEMLEARRARR
jgi:hypothetical protein